MIDLSFLYKFTQGDASKTAKYIRMYLQYAPETMAAIKLDLEQSAWPALAVHAHSLKPQADFMGNRELKQILEAIEEKVRTGQLEELASLVHAAVLAHEAATPLLEKELEKLGI